MEFSQEIETSVVIKPIELEQLQKNILKKLLSNVCGKCMEDVGYICDIKEIISVDGKNIVDQNAKFNVRCIARVIKPTVGDTIEAEVTAILGDSLVAENGPVEVCAMIFSTSKVYEHHTYEFKILEYRLYDDKIICVGEMV